MPATRKIPSENLSIEIDHKHGNQTSSIYHYKNLYLVLSFNKKKQEIIRLNNHFLIVKNKMMFSLIILP
jgi:hypothetical protein